MTVYADEAFLLNGAVDYLLLVCAAKLGGGRILRLYKASKRPPSAGRHSFLWQSLPKG